MATAGVVMKMITMIGTAKVAEEVLNTISTTMRTMAVGTIAMMTRMITIMIVGNVEVTMKTKMRIGITDHVITD
jgi:hypothetical protein